LKKRFAVLMRAAGKALRFVRRFLVLYLDDLLALGAGACLTIAAAQLLGQQAALITAGAHLWVFAVMVAKSKGGGKP